MLLLLSVDCASGCIIMESEKDDRPAFNLESREKEALRPGLLHTAHTRAAPRNQLSRKPL